MGRRWAFHTLTMLAMAALIGWVPSTGHGGDLVDWIFHRDVVEEEPLAMKQLAHVIREIDAALFRKGMVGVKAPDVWGQNRMTKYRAEYELEMAKNSTKYATMIQGAQRRTDVAALTNAMAISAGMSPPPGRRGLRPAARAPTVIAPLQPMGAAHASPAPVTINNYNAAGGGGSAGAGGGSGGGAGGSSEPTLPDLADIAQRIDKMQSTVLNLPNNIVNFAGKPGDPGVSLEPTLQLDEQSAFLNHLYKLRRKSAGDDLTDLPGYGLYLVRLPISILPGKATRRGMGAVVTLEAKHELTHDLLENTVRDVVVKDVLYNIKEPVLWAIRSNFTVPKGESAPDESYEKRAHEWKVAVLKVQIDRLQKQKQHQDELKRYESDLLKAVRDADATKASASTETPPALVSPGVMPIPTEVLAADAETDAKKKEAAETKKAAAPAPAEKAAETVGADESQPKLSSLGLPTVGYGVSGPNPAGESSSQMIQFLGPPFLARLGEEIRMAIHSDVSADSDVFAWLNVEIQNAYRYMRQAIYEAERSRVAGTDDCGIAPLFQAKEIEQIAEPLLCRDFVKLLRVRNNFLARLYYRRYKLPYFDETRYMSNNDADKEYRIMIDRDLSDRIRAADILCYVVLVQLILIDRQIKQDMRIMHDRRDYPYDDATERTPLDSPQGPGLRFYDFCPTLEAKTRFEEYVRCKWPIHVYALDPEVDQQNILDAYSQRTELQLALSVALSAGKVGFKDAAKYARQLDLDLTTIGLNRTAVGFGAGRTTFGWRFYPRVQTPPSPSNPARIVGTLLYNGTRPDYDLLNREIEPGQRECVAVMVVPNFVPAIRMMSEANWFGLGPHSHQKFDPGDLLRLSRKLEDARQTLTETGDQPRYRTGELERMADRIDQLESMMPTQSFRVDLPDEGDFAGSEIFSSDAANLSPSLLTWFGEPPTLGKASDVFLLGKGFSVIESQVIAGGIKAPQDLISRNVIRVTIPAEARTVEVNLGDKPAKYFDVHLATPNGISDYHMLIPAKEEKPEPPFGYTVDAKTKTLDVTIEYWSPPPGAGPAPAAPVPLQYVRGLVAGDAKVKLTLRETVGLMPPSVHPSFTFPAIQGHAAAPYRPPGPVPFDPLESGYVMHAPELTGLAHHIASLVLGAGIDPRNPPAAFKTIVLKPVKVRPFLGGQWGAEVDASQSLTVNVKFLLGAAPPPVPTPILAAPPGVSPLPLPGRCHPAPCPHGACAIPPPPGGGPVPCPHRPCPGPCRQEAYPAGPAVIVVPGPSLLPPPSLPPLPVHLTPQKPASAAPRRPTALEHFPPPPTGLGAFALPPASPQPVQPR